MTSEALKALAVLTSHPAVRESLRSMQPALGAAITRWLPIAEPNDIQESALTVLANLATSRPHAETIVKCKGLTDSMVSSMSPTRPANVQSR